MRRHFVEMVCVLVAQAFMFLGMPYSAKAVPSPGGLCRSRRVRPCGIWHRNRLQVYLPEVG